VAAEHRIKEHNVVLAAVLQEMVKGFIDRHIYRELSLLGRFCQDFVDQLGDALTGGRELAPELRMARLGFGTSEVRTPAILSAAVLAAQDVLLPKIEEILTRSEGATREVLLGSLTEYLKQRDTQQRLIEIGRQQGLTKKEVRSFCNYLAELLSEKPDLFIEDLSISSER
jgi:site-specific recombinase XerC